jgi:hypothetical protein
MVVHLLTVALVFLRDESCNEASMGAEDVRTAC